MTLGTWDDVEAVRAELGEAALRETLNGAPAGIFDATSWHYWHKRFGHERVPSLPRCEMQDPLNTFAPRLDILPPAQQRLWPELKGIPPQFVILCRRDLPKLPEETKRFLSQQASRVETIPAIPRVSDRI